MLGWLKKRLGIKTAPETRDDRADMVAVAVNYWTSYLVPPSELTYEWRNRYTPKTRKKEIEKEVNGKKAAFAQSLAQLLTASAAEGEVIIRVENGKPQGILAEALSAADIRTGAVNKAGSNIVPAYPDNWSGFLTKDEVSINFNEGVIKRPLVGQFLYQRNPGVEKLKPEIAETYFAHAGHQKPRSHTEPFVDSGMEELPKSNAVERVIATRKPQQRG